MCLRVNLALREPLEGSEGEQGMFGLILLMLCGTETDWYLFRGSMRMWTCRTTYNEGMIL